MKRVLVVGGGLAGLSSSVYLSDSGFEVTLLEASPKLGGRTYSMYNDRYEDYYDNGQHILMGCYEYTLDFINKIGGTDKLYFQESLEINFVKRGGNLFHLKAGKYFYPLNLLFAILKFKALRLKDRFKIIDFFLELMCCFDEDLRDKTVKEWLQCKKQSDDSVRNFWEILVVGALNTTIEKASAEMFAEILKRIFLQGSKASTIVVPKTGLSQLFSNLAGKFIETNHGQIILSEKVLEIEVSDKRITSVSTDKNVYKDFDAVILAVPTFALAKIQLTGTTIQFNIPDLQYSPIVNIHLWLSENPFKEKFYGLIGSDIHWLFNHGTHITLMTSAADQIITLGNSEIKRHFCSELEKYFSIFHSEMILDFVVIKEKRATFIPDITSNRKRKEKVSSQIENLFFAGDWTDTDLPSTIESAVMSGKLISEQVIPSLK
ncbi:MAG: hydroxysqualene dehydroxylase HpnE [Bacteroidetes bacterium]|nr:hydroxysqualene dehydroxylase HpnE [Bacteroidota bacterium]